MIFHATRNTRPLAIMVRPHKIKKANKVSRIMWWRSTVSLEELLKSRSARPYYSRRYGLGWICPGAHEPDVVVIRFYDKPEPLIQHAMAARIAEEGRKK